MSTHRLENESLCVTIADAGAELCSVIDKETGTERIWTADPAVWNRHSPILFPFVGKVTDGKYRIGTREYTMRTQHGFARDMDFACVEKTENSVTHRLLSNEDTLKNYPYAFQLTVRHILSPDRRRSLSVEWTVENTGKECMYYSIGGHPGFLMPAGARKEECWIEFPGRSRLQYYSANAAGFALPAQKYSLELDNGFTPYRDDIPDTWIFDGQDIKTVRIAGPDRKPSITMNCAGFPLLAIWANRAGPFICLEPWFGRTDDNGFSGTLAEKPGMETLESGEKKQISYDIEFHAS